MDYNERLAAAVAVYEAKNNTLDEKTQRNCIHLLAACHLAKAFADLDLGPYVHHRHVDAVGETLSSSLWDVVDNVDPDVLDDFGNYGDDDDPQFSFVLSSLERLLA